MPLFTPIKKLFYSLFIVISYIAIFLYIILEELVWEKFAKSILKYIEYLRVFELIEEYLHKANRYVIISIFLVLLIIGELLGILSPIILVKGFLIVSIIFYILKLLLIALALWIFNKERSKLLSFKWLNFLYNKALFIINKIKNSHVYKKTTTFIKQFKANLKHYLRFFINRVKNFLKFRL